MSRQTLYELLRFEKKTSELKDIAKRLKVDISDIPQNRHQKEAVVQRLLGVMSNPLTFLGMHT